MNLYTVPFYRHAPFLRIVIPFAAGIFLQNKIAFPQGVLWILTSVSVMFALLTGIGRIGSLYGSVAMRGTIIHACLVLFGAICFCYGNPANNRLNLANQYQQGARLVMTLQEPLSGRAGSYKSTASVELIQHNGGFRKCTGNILVYFEKDSVNLKLRYGDRIVISAAVQPVSSTGNPAAFNYRDYCAMQGIYHQVYLVKSDYLNTGINQAGIFKSFLFKSRLLIIAILKKNIPGAKEAGLAAALLIGVKDELDKELVQSYSNTGVVHVIAISGLHLGLIYAILVLLTEKLKRFRQGRVLRLMIILSGIWLFSLLAGGSASVVRSAVMFSCIATGNALSKTSSVYNSLAGSAFLLLAYNPFWLWDTGFQLSYAAVLSIIIFQGKIYGLFELQNRLLVMVWKTCAITISAQILTTPVSMFYFHQFPILFLVTNFLAIPLSSLILICEIVLCLIAPLTVLAEMAGSLTGRLISIMNSFVESVDGLPHANWQGLQIDTGQCLLLYVIIASIDQFLRKTDIRLLLIGLGAILMFFAARSRSFFRAGTQEKLIVYNISRHSAIEFIRGRNSFFLADSILENNQEQIRFHILPSRILHRIARVSSPGPDTGKEMAFAGNRCKVLRISGPVELRTSVNVLIISGNAYGTIEKLVKGKLPELIVFDCSNSRNRVRTWMKECGQMGIQAWSVPDQGAFVMKLN